MIKKQLNPFLFLLLKRMIEFEVSDTLVKKTTREQVYKHIGDLTENDGKTEKIFSSGDKKVSRSTFAEHIRRYVWMKQDFCFLDHTLDMMCQLLNKLGNYNSWNEFTAVHGFSPDALHAEQYKSKLFSILNPSEKQIISSTMEMRLARMYDQYRKKQRMEAIKSPLEFAEEDDNQFQFARPADIKLIADLAKRVYPCPINDSDIKEKWYRKNSNLFIVCKDAHGELLANINLLPLKKNFYNDLKSGRIYENRITADDLYATSEKENIDCIYIEGYASITSEVQRDFRRRFYNIVEAITPNIKNSMIICAIGGSTAGDNLMLKYGFKHTGMAIDPSDDKEYQFMETTWGSLKKAIKEMIEQSQMLN